MPVPPVDALSAQISQTVSRIAELLRIDLAVVALKAVQVAGVLAPASHLGSGDALLQLFASRSEESSANPR